MKKRFSIILISILTLGALIRLLYLGSLPGGFFRDEAALGYNSWSLLLTGKDEFGMRLPLVFRSFEVFFLPLYEYLTAGIMAIFGLSEFSTRLLSALSGVLLLYVSYLIASKLWNKRAGLFAILFLAISPWHIIYSRGAFEGNLALTLFSLGFYFWIKFRENRNTKVFFASILFFALSMYSYQAERVVVPLFGVAAIFIDSAWITKNTKKIITPVIIGAIILIPLLTLTFKAGGYHRAFGVSVFSTQKTPVGWEEGTDSGLFANNRMYLTAKEISSLYFSYFSPRNLFIEGDYNRQRSVDDFSVLYAWMFPLLIYGTYSAFKKRKSDIELLFLWALLAPIPAALTGDPFHTYRSLLLYLPLTILAAYGASEILEKLKKHMRIVIGAFLVFSSASLLFFGFNYVVLSNATHAKDWDYGYKEVINYIDSLDAKKVVVDDRATEAYIHYLFQTMYEPAEYQKIVAELGDINNYYYSDPSEIRPTKVDNVEFRNVDWPKERGDEGTVFVMKADLLPESEFKTDPKIELLKEIRYPDGTTAFRIVRVL